MKRALPLLLATAALGAAGCGADAGTTDAQNSAFKSGAKPANIVIPPGANKPPPNFHSSLENESVHAPAGGTGPTPRTTG